MSELGNPSDQFLLLSFQIERKGNVNEFFPPSVLIDSVAIERGFFPPFFFFSSIYIFFFFNFFFIIMIYFIFLFAAFCWRVFGCCYPCGLSRSSVADCSFRLQLIVITAENPKHLAQRPIDGAGGERATPTGPPPPRHLSAIGGVYHSNSSVALFQLHSSPHSTLISLLFPL